MFGAALGDMWTEKVVGAGVGQAPGSRIGFHEGERLCLNFPNSIGGLALRESIGETGE